MIQTLLAAEEQNSKRPTTADEPEVVKMISAIFLTGRLNRGHGVYLGLWLRDRQLLMLTRRNDWSCSITSEWRPHVTSSGPGLGGHGETVQITLMWIHHFQV